jgi:hypothetical protein
VPRTVHQTIVDHAFPIAAAYLEQPASSHHIGTVIAGLHTLVEDWTFHACFWPRLTRWISWLCNMWLIFLSHDL